MGFGLGFLLGAVGGAVATLLFTPLEGRDARAIVLGPFGWREVETEPETTWTPSTGVREEPAATIQ